MRKGLERDVANHEVSTGYLCVFLKITDPNATLLMLLFIPHPGKLITDSSRPLGPTFSGITGEFYPALSLYGMNVKLTVHTGETYDEHA